jgi:hypothetical protein
MALQETLVSNGIRQAIVGVVESASHLETVSRVSVVWALDYNSVSSPCFI